MKEFEEYLEDNLEDVVERAAARELLNKILHAHEEEGFEGFFTMLSMLDMVENTDYFFVAWAAFRIVDLEFIPGLWDSPELLQRFCRSQAGIDQDLCWN
jgi:hypothetical protein